MLLPLLYSTAICAVSRSLLPGPPPELISAGYSDKYIAVRTRFAEDFFFGGFVATERWHDNHNPSIEKHLSFSDQTVYLGHALLAFSLEVENLTRCGLESSQSELAINNLLKSFDKCEIMADIELNGYYTSGFFLRDYVKTSSLELNRAGEVHLHSDFLHDMVHEGAANNAMSLDQVVHLFAGLMATSRWSRSESNRTHAKQIADRIIKYLISKSYMVAETPSGISINRGTDYRFAAGWLSEMAGYITGVDFLNDPSNRVGDHAVVSKFTTIQSYIHNPGLLVLGVFGAPSLAQVLSNIFGSENLASFAENNYSHSHALVRLLLACSGDTPDYTMWAWANVGRCPISELLYTEIQDKPVPQDVRRFALKLIEEMPDTGPSSELARQNGWRHNWGKESRIIRSRDLKWSPNDAENAGGKVYKYNGLDFMILSSLVLITRSRPLIGRPVMRTSPSGDRWIEWTEAE